MTPDRSPGPRREFLDELIELLWPGAHITVSRWHKPHRHVYALLPNSARPTVAVPLWPRSAASSVLRNYKLSARGTERLRLQILATAAQWGFLQVWPGQVRISPSPPGIHSNEPVSISEYLCEVLGYPVVVSPYITPPRANRKPVLQVLTGAGQTLGYAKIGMNSLTNQLVEAESRNLVALHGLSLRSLDVPSVLHAGTWAGHAVLMQRLLGGAGFITADTLIAATAEIALIGKNAVNPQANSYLDALRSRLIRARDSLGRTTRARQLLAALECLLAVHQAGFITADGRHPQGGIPVEPLLLGSWHGDWTPWNMTARPGGGVAAWDWERFETGVPVGYDALHFEIQRALVIHGRDPLVAAESLVDRAAVVLAPYSIRPERARWLALLYLIEIGTRYESDGLAQTADRLGNIDTWLTVTLRRHLGVGGPP
ncbi:MAG: hypothetical protein ACRCTR_07590 [Actinomycetota bacterium]